MKTKVWLAALLGSLAGLTAGSSHLHGESTGVLESETTVPSGGSEAGAQQPSDGAALGPQTSVQGMVQGPTTPLPLAATVGAGFLGPGFDDNATKTGSLSIPPDPMGAAGTDRVIAVVNRMIEARSKTGSLLYLDSLRDFFSSLPLRPGTQPFDPKIVYDHYEDRFLVVAIELVEASTNPSSGNFSRLLLAVSKTGTPATATTADWWFHLINSKTSISGFDHWADYPGFEVDEEAVYITANMFQHVARGFGGVRLWIVDKGAVGGFYAGGSPAVTVHDPYAGGGAARTTMPAEVFGAGGVGPGIGTFLVSYSGLTAGGPAAPESVQVVRIDNPLGAPSFTRESVTVGDIEDVGGLFGFPALPDAPQSGTATRIEVNDRRALDAVWRDGSLWLTTTIEPNSGPSAGETTAHWFRLDTSAVTDSTAGPGLITLGDQGDIHGEDIVNDLDEVTTFFPAVAVNGSGDAMFGFSASASTMFAGAYVTGRRANDPPGTVRDSETVQAGRDFYIRTFSGSRNRWGDYSGIALDPMDDNVFWVFNEFADLRGTPTGTPPQDGRWGTAWARATYEGVSSDFNADSHSDILWRNTAVATALIWQMNGFTKQASGSIGAPPLSWEVSGLGDFNGGGQADILWRNASSGNALIWQMNGFLKEASTGIGGAPTAWQIAGVGDFDGDGMPDILWRNSGTGGAVIWRMVDLVRDSVASIGAPPLDWEIAGVGDFDGDGTDDILWRNTGTGAALIWRMVGLAKDSVASIGGAPLAWQIEGLGDFDLDGTDDILWRNPGTGSTLIWRIVGLAKDSSWPVGTASPPWQVVCVANYDGGSADILWRNTGSNSAVIWQMDGFTLQATGSIGAPSSDWEVRC